jgi:hypothetical protein
MNLKKELILFSEWQEKKVLPNINEEMVDSYLKETKSNCAEPIEKLCRKNENFICNCIDDSRCPNFK